MDIAIAALNEVAANARSEADHNEPASLSTSIDKQTAASTRALAQTSPSMPEEANILNFPSGSSDNSQTTQADATTPPTSEEYLGHSQESQSQLSQLSQLAAAQHPLQSSHMGAAREVSHVATNAGQKRTHDGFRKDSSSSSSNSPPASTVPGHSRNVSAVSMASSTASTRELTSELRTRLTYAMVKVSKGWESLPIEEVESLASQKGSPGGSSTSTLNGRRNVLTSPRAVIAHIQGPPQLKQQTSNGSQPSSQGDTVVYGESQPTRTYESFWAQQGQKSTGQSSQYSLAPSADIVASTKQSSNLRRLQSPNHKPPTLFTHGSGHSQLSSANNAPHTPSRDADNESMMQTPTQKSLQERDAIETLLFMSSPGNSSTMRHTFSPNHGPASQLQSPLRTEFSSQYRGAQGRRVEFSGLHASHSDGIGSRPSSSGTQIRSNFRKLRDDEMDQLLDSAPDPESSDEEIEIPITPRRMAAGRV